MRQSLIPLTLAVLLATPVIVVGQAAFPRMTSVEPDTGKAGAVLNVAGENLDKQNVAQLFLTDGKNDVKVQMTDQTATAIKFTIPVSVKPGRFNLMVLTAGKDPKLIEQPVKITVE